MKGELTIELESLMQSLKPDVPASDKKAAMKRFNISKTEIGRILCGEINNTDMSTRVFVFLNKKKAARLKLLTLTKA